MLPVQYPSPLQRPSAPRRSEPTFSGSSHRFALAGLLGLSAALLSQMAPKDEFKGKDHPHGSSMTAPQQSIAPPFKTQSSVQTTRTTHHSPSVLEVHGQLTGTDDKGQPATVPFHGTGFWAQDTQTNEWFVITATHNFKKFVTKVDETTKLPYRQGYSVDFLTLRPFGDPAEARKQGKNPTIAPFEAVPNHPLKSLLPTAGYSMLEVTDVTAAKVKDTGYRYPVTRRSVVFRNLQTHPLKAGEALFTIGSPDTSSFQYAQGHVLDPAYKDSDIDLFNTFVRAHLPAKPGSSGSPVWDGQGHLVGIINKVHTEQPNITFIQPVSEFLPELRKWGIHPPMTP